MEIEKLIERLDALEKRIDEIFKLADQAIKASTHAATVEEVLALSTSEQELQGLGQQVLESNKECKEALDLVAERQAKDGEQLAAIASAQGEFVGEVAKVSEAFNKLEVAHKVHALQIKAQAEALSGFDARVEGHKNDLVERVKAATKK